MSSWVRATPALDVRRAGCRRRDWARAGLGSRSGGLVLPRGALGCGELLLERAPLIGVEIFARLKVVERLDALFATGCVVREEGGVPECMPEIGIAQVFAIGGQALGQE